MNIIWGACCTFIPNEYRVSFLCTKTKKKYVQKKIFLLGENWRNSIREHIPIEALPTIYGSECLNNVNIPIPSLCNKKETSEFVNQLDHESLDTVVVPAGKLLLPPKKYFL